MKSSKRLTLIVGVAIVKIKNIEIPRKTCVKSAELPADHDHHLTQTAVQGLRSLGHLTLANTLARGALASIDEATILSVAKKS